MANGSI